MEQVFPWEIPTSHWRPVTTFQWFRLLGGERRVEPDPHYSSVLQVPAKSLHGGQFVRLACIFTAYASFLTISGSIFDRTGSGVRCDEKCASTAAASRCDTYVTMGRLSKTSMTSGRPNMKVHYRKLVDEYSGQCDSLKFVPTLPEYLSYCCHHCGHQQKLKVNDGCSVSCMTEAPKCHQKFWTCLISFM